MAQADAARRRKVSTNAVAMVATDTTPMVNGAVIIAVSAQASGYTPAIITLNARTTATNTAVSARTQPRQSPP